MSRRLFLASVSASASALALSACGFELRRAPELPFTTLYINGSARSTLVTELRRQLVNSADVQVLETRDAARAQVVLDVLTDQRERVVVGVGTAGQVREFQLRVRFRFRLRNPAGEELIAPVELLQQRDISYSESAALAKEAEEALLYRDMQSDIVQQTLRRLAAVKSI